MAKSSAVIQSTVGQFGKAIPARRFIFFAFIIGVIVYRLVLPIRAGQFGPDESLFLVRAQSIVRGDSLPLVGLSGNYGMFYGPYPSYFFAAAYGVTGFSLGRVFLISSTLLLTAPLLLAAAARRMRHTTWIFLLALTSPLAIYFSVLGLWDTPLLIPLSALILYVARPGTQIRTWREFAIGSLLGISLGVHLQVIPFVAGISTWRFLLTRRKRPILALVSGMFVAVLPYLLGLWQIRDQLSPSLGRSGEEALAPDPWALLTSLFRFWGGHPGVRINSNSWFLGAEVLLAQVTFGLIIVLLLMSAYYIWRSRGKLPSIENPLTAFALCAAFYVPFAYITNTGSGNQYGQTLWWFAPLVIPIVVMGVLPRKAAAVCLSLLVAFNLVTTSVEYLPRLRNGTGIEWGHGPSWWMQEQVVADLHREVERRGGQITIVELACKYCDYTLDALIEVKHPDIAHQVGLVPSAEKGTGKVLRVEPDEDRIHLRVRWVMR